MFIWPTARSNPAKCSLLNSLINKNKKNKNMNIHFTYLFTHFPSPSYLYRFRIYYSKISVLITKYEETIINDHKMAESVTDDRFNHSI